MTAQGIVRDGVAFVRRAAAVCLALAGVGALAACQMPEKAADRGKVHVGIVFDSGGKDDRSFNAAA
ncbi:MAG TPA: hypothetical protein VGE98_04335, partial [Thermoanaerobaculia bacterium]